MPTEKQKTCPHPPEFIVILPDNMTRSATIAMDCSMKTYLKNQVNLL